MADISTAVSMARVPILGENGRISDDYVPDAIGQGVQSAQDAAAAAESAKTAAETARDASVTAKDGAESAKTAAESAKTGAESAKAAAESAKTSAEGSASQAATSAQKAADSAQQAADKAASVLDHYIASATATTLEPGSDATATVADKVLQLGIPRGDKGDKGDKGDPGDVSAVQAAEGSDLSVSTSEGTVTIDDSALRARIAELEQQAQNVVTGTSTGLVSHGEDAFPQKPREVRIKGKTWVNRWPVINFTAYGVTVSTSEDGLIALSGTASASFIAPANVQGVSPNKQITVVSSKQIGTGVSTAGLWVRFFDSDGAVIGNVNPIAFQNSNPVTLTTPSNMAYMTANVVVYEGVTVNASFRVMLVDGTEAPDCFTPYASITSVQPGNLVTSGKNLVPKLHLDNLESAGVTATLNDDNSITLNGTTTAIATFALLGTYPFTDVLGEFVPGTYTLSIGSAPSGLTFEIMDWREYEPVFTLTTTYSSSSTKTLSNITEYTYIRIQIIEGTTFNNVTVYLQLELGSTATAYEPPTVTTTPLPEVELRSLPNGTCDELVIKADGTCEVERRTQIVDGEVAALDTPTTEPQSPVTLPVLPAPTFNQYHDGPVPSDTSTGYARDINIVLDKLQAQISATTVREATNG